MESNEKDVDMADAPATQPEGGDTKPNPFTLQKSPIKRKREDKEDEPEAADGPAEAANATEDAGKKSKKNKNKKKKAKLDQAAEAPTEPPPQELEMSKEVMSSAAKPNIAEDSPEITSPNLTDEPVAKKDKKKKKKSKKNKHDGEIAEQDKPTAEPNYTEGEVVPTKSEEEVDPTVEAQVTTEASAETKEEKKKRKHKKNKKVASEEAVEVETTVTTAEDPPVVATAEVDGKKKKKKSKKSNKDTVETSPVTKEAVEGVPKEDTMMTPVKESATEPVAEPTSEAKNKKKKMKKTKQAGKDDSSQGKSTPAKADAGEDKASQGEELERWNVPGLDGGPARQDRFLRLLGGKKAGLAVVKAPDEKTGGKSGGDGGGRERLDFKHVEEDLEKQFESSMKAKHEGGHKKKGLGA